MLAVLYHAHLYQYAHHVGTPVVCAISGRLHAGITMGDRWWAVVAPGFRVRQSLVLYSIIEHCGMIACDSITA